LLAEADTIARIGIFIAKCEMLGGA
jgi:hypothetical protein